MLTMIASTLIAIVIYDVIATIIYILVEDKHE